MVVVVKKIKERRIMATIKICDICKSSKDVESKSFCKGYQSDPAGGRAEEIYEYYDLCKKCELKLYKSFFKKHLLTQAKKDDIDSKMIEILKDMKKKN